MPRKSGRHQVEQPRRTARARTDESDNEPYDLMSDPELHADDILSNRDHDVFANPLCYRIIINNRAFMTGAMIANSEFIPRDIYVHAFNMSLQAGHKLPKTLLRQVKLNYGAFRVAYPVHRRLEDEFVPFWNISEVKAIIAEIRQAGSRILDATLNVAVVFPDGFVFPPAWISPLHRPDTSAARYVDIDYLLEDSRKGHRACCVVA
jgi:hypothetical protein